MSVVSEQAVQHCDREAFSTTSLMPTASAEELSNTSFFFNHHCTSVIDRSASRGWAVSRAACSVLLPASELIIAGCSALPELLETADEVKTDFML